MFQTQDLRMTIVVPTKDRPKLLAAAVHSALASLPDGAEVLVVDDRSEKPASGSKLGDDKRLRFTVSEAMPGASGARNWGVGLARGKRILFLDDDDLMIKGYPDWVLKQQADYGFSPVLSFRGVGAPPMVQYPGGQGSAIPEQRRFRHQVGGLGCGFWIDRAAFLASGGIAEDILVNEDLEFSMRLLRSGLRGLRAPAGGVMVRKHRALAGERGHLTSSVEAAERARLFGEIISRHSDWFPERPDAARHLLKRQLKLLVRSGDKASIERTLASPLARPHQVGLKFYVMSEEILSRLKRR